MERGIVFSELLQCSKTVLRQDNGIATTELARTTRPWLKTDRLPRLSVGEAPAEPETSVVVWLGCRHGARREPRPPM